MESQRTSSNPLPVRFLSLRRCWAASTSLRCLTILALLPVTAGFGVEDLCHAFEADHDDYNSIMNKALADRLAEAFAECLHKASAGEWGYEESRTSQLRRFDPAKKYQRHSARSRLFLPVLITRKKWNLWRLLDVQQRTGIKLN